MRGPHYSCWTDSPRPAVLRRDSSHVHSDLLIPFNMIYTAINLKSLLILAVSIMHIRGTGVPSASVYTTVKTREHETIFLPCYVGNLDSSSVRWWHEDKIVTEAGEIFTEQYYKIHLNNTLEVTNVTENLSGAYICQIIRPQPMLPIKHNYIIQVLHPPKVWLSPSQGEVEVEMHQEVSLYCNATGSPQPFITWTFKGEEIPDKRNENTLSIIAVKETSGEYACIASNGVGSSDMNSVVISAVYPPSINADKIWIHTSPGLRTVIECTIEGSPPPKVDWLKDSQPMPKDPRITYFKKDNIYGVVIKASRITDVGHYTCIASNKLGMNKLSIEVSALANTAQFKTVQDKFEDRVTLVWEVESYSPIIQYSLLFRQLVNEVPSNWTKLTIPADDSGGAPIHTQSYTIYGLDRASFYEASIISKNIFGWSKPSNLFQFFTSGSSAVEVSEPNYTSTTEDEEEEEEVESNTITDFLSDYATDLEENETSELVTSHEKRTAQLSSLYFITIMYLILRLTL